MAKQARRQTRKRAPINFYRRALQLRRAIIPHILHKDPTTGAVALTDALDDVLEAALAREAKLAVGRCRRRFNTPPAKGGW